jgi:flagellar hook-associated protein 1
MRSTFFGLNTLLRALQAQQQALDTTNHNIANAGTDGFSRQQVSMTTTAPYTAPAANKPYSTPLHLGTGVVVSEIRRQRDLFLDLELRRQTQEHAEWDTVAGGLAEIEAIFSEPGEFGVRELMTKFFSAWSDLSNNPQSGAARTAVRSTGEALSLGLNDVANRLTASRQDTSSSIALKVPEVNDLGTRLASLNAHIANVTAQGDVPNDMLDERDRLLDQIVKLTGATYRHESDSTITVSIGGRAFVSGNSANLLATETKILASGTRIHEVQWAMDGVPVTFEGGEIGGLIRLRDELIPQQLRQLDLLASSIAGNVNEIHRGGFGTGEYANKVSNFFEPMTGAKLSETGLATDLVAGTVTVGTTTITVSPQSQSLMDVMTQVMTAINSSPGVTAPATWALDPETGRVTVNYQTAAASTTVKMGGPGDSSNLLSLLGLVGAQDLVVGTTGGNSDRQITGQLPVALVSAAGIRLDQAIKNDINAIATAAGASSGLSTSAGPGDNRNALAMAALQRSALGALSGFTMHEYFATTTADLGAVTRQAQQSADTQNMLVGHLEARRESFSGVSLDEEATQLIRFQRAYQAAARGISAVDEMLETIITRMGRVGN